LKSKPIVSSFSFPKDKEEIIYQATIIAARERTSLSGLILSLLETYVKTHGSGNPSYEITKWAEQPEFVADPAIREKNEKWDKYLSQCDAKDLQQLEGTFQLRAKQARKAWLEKNKP
jgi:hypothetical protein